MISVLMGVLCSKDRIEGMEDAVRSILSQTYQDFELLICDNGSCQQVQVLLDTLAAYDHRIHLLRPVNVDTLRKKLNACLSAAKGEFIARMDDDDFSHPTRFEEQLSFLNQHPEIDFVGCNIMQVDENGTAGVRYLPMYPTVADFRFALPYIHPALLFRRDALLVAGGYSESKWSESCEDYDLLLKLYEQGCRGANIQQVLLNYSIENSQRQRKPYRHRVNEAVTRYSHFRTLKKLPAWWPYVVKPLAVGLLPLPVLARLKAMRNRSLEKFNKT
jgi:glycosyltransferase involved in cell wall biosynthesis